MINLIHAHMNEIGIPTILESSIVIIQSSQISLMGTNAQEMIMLACMQTGRLH